MTKASNFFMFLFKGLKRFFANCLVWLHCFVWLAMSPFKDKADGAHGAGIALVLAFLVMLPSCRTIPKHDVFSSSQSDSIIARQQSIIERQKIDYNALYEEYSRISDELSARHETSTSEIVVVEKFDTTGVLRERQKTEKLSSDISEITDKIDAYRKKITETDLKMDSLRQVNDSLSMALHNESQAVTQTIVEKKVIPLWCWYLLVADMILLLYIVFRILRKLGIIKI